MATIKARLDPKIQQFQKREAPINYSNLQINAGGMLEERKSKTADYSESLDKRIVKGYAVIWGSKNDYQERFVKGCAAKSINDLGPASNSAYKIKFRDRHGKSCSLFASIIEDDIGLYFETLPLDNVQWANDLLVQLKSGTINNFSIGFKHVWDRVEWDDEEDCMVNLEIRLFEISAVDIPSDIETYAVRSMEEREYLEDDIEDFIESLPKSKRIEARIILTRCMSPIDTESSQERSSSSRDNTPAKESIDFGFLIDNL